MYGAWITGAAPPCGHENGKPFFYKPSMSRRQFKQTNMKTARAVFI
jgi:hypothetical protein